MKITDHHLAIIRDMGGAYLAKYGYTFEDVKLGRDAWDVLHQSGAYSVIGGDFVGGYPDYKDAHFQTALKTIMPNATFKDTCRY